MTTPRRLEGFAEFEFDLPKALKSELIRVLDSMETGVLQPTLTGQVPEAQGVYQIFRDGELVYIGKTDAEAGLRTRLTRHAKKIMHRPTLSGAIHFKAVRILVFTAMDLETQLIKHYRALVRACSAWNGSGFGSNDPGRERETTNKHPEGFDSLHLIDIDHAAELLDQGTTTVASALIALAALPYTLRYETERNAGGRALANRPHAELLAASIAVPAGPQTARDLMNRMRQALGPEWQATAFVSHLILYKERRQYQYGELIC